MAAIVAFWLGTVLADAASLALDPQFADVHIEWRHFLVKKPVLAVFWMFVSAGAVLALRGRDVGPGWLRRSVFATALIAAPVAAAHTALAVLMVLLLTGLRVPLDDAIAIFWPGETLRAYLLTGQIAVAAHAYDFYQRFVGKRYETERLRAELVQTELDLLRAQLEPHFLFNALNSIAALVRLDRTEEASIALGRLGVLLRGMLELGDQPLTTWRQEAGFTTAYLALQELRFGERLEVGLDPDALPGDTPFPAFVLQPLLENALQHGPLADGERCRVVVQLARSDGLVRLNVANALGRARRDGHGVGLGNVEARLRSLYGADQLRFDARPAEGRFVVEIAFPAPEAA